MRRQSDPSWKNNPGLGFSGYTQRVRKNHRAIPLHANGFVCKPGGLIHLINNVLEEEDPEK